MGGTHYSKEGGTFLYQPRIRIQYEGENDSSHQIWVTVNPVMEASPTGIRKAVEGACAMFLTSTARDLTDPRK